MTMGLEECIYIWYYTYVYGVIYQYVRGSLIADIGFWAERFELLGAFFLMSDMSVFRY